MKGLIVGSIVTAVALCSMKAMADDWDCTYAGKRYSQGAFICISPLVSQTCTQDKINNRPVWGTFAIQKENECAGAFPSLVEGGLVDGGPPEMPPAPQMRR